MRILFRVRLDFLLAAEALFGKTSPRCDTARGRIGMPSSMQDASSSSVRASTETDGAPFVVTYIDGNRVEGTASSSAEPRPDVTVPTIFEKSARVKAMRHVHVRKPDVSDPVVLGIASRFGCVLVHALYQYL